MYFNAFLVTYYQSHLTQVQYVFFVLNSLSTYSRLDIDLILTTAINYALANLNAINYAINLAYPKVL